MVSNMIGGGVFLLLGLVALVVGVLKLLKWRKITSTETIPVRDAVVADGVVEVEGEVELADGNAFTSPMTNQDSVVYEYTLHRGIKDKTLVDSGSASQSFVVNDGTAKAYVNPDTASVSLKLDRIEDVSVSDMPEYVQTRPTIRGTRVFEEGTINVGDDVYVLGSTKQTTQEDADTEFTDSDDWFIISNQDASETAKRLLKFGGIFTPLGAVMSVVGVLILTGII